MFLRYQLSPDYLEEYFIYNFSLAFLAAIGKSVFSIVALSI